MITIPTQMLPGVAQYINDSDIHPFECVLDFKTFASLRRMVANQHTKPLVRRTDFMKLVTLYLPEVAALIDESDFGIVHLEVGAMKLATKSAITNHDFNTVRRYLLFVADLFDRADIELYDAIRISYLDGLFLEETSTVYLEARSFLSKSMENVLRQSERRLEKQSELRNDIIEKQIKPRSMYTVA